MGHGDLAEGDDLRNHLLIYRSYVGSNTPSDAKTYDVSVKVDAPCAEDWGTINNVDMSTNVAESIDIKRACPVITDLVDITVNEDSGTYTLTLTDKADDVQDEENTLTWTVADDTDPSQRAQVCYWTVVYLVRLWPLHLTTTNSVLTSSTSVSKTVTD